MVALAPVVLLLATQASLPGAPSAISSTYDQATCADQAEDADAESVSAAQDDECAEPMSPTPAVVDCASVWVRDMIGSCDMPRTARGERVLALRGRNEGPGRVCVGFACGHSSIPLHGDPAPSGDEPVLVSRLPFGIYFETTGLPSVTAAPVPADSPFRLERPPRG